MALHDAPADTDGVTTRTPKRVYVLGAGFSREAALPLQAEILSRIRDFNLMDIPTDVFEAFVSAQEQLFPFLRRAFPASEDPNLEDVFTLLDHSIAKREDCLGEPWMRLVEIRDALTRAILSIIHHAAEGQTPQAEALYHGVASSWLALRVASGQAADPLSVITLNWDYLVEDSIYACIADTATEGRVDIDYCCYSTPLDASSPHVPSLLQRSRGIYNMKVVKLHGSATFLRCPNCDRLYTGIGSGGRVWDQYVLPTWCRLCPAVDLAGDGVSARPLLEPFLISPTFLKVFDNVHIRTIWHNAYVELSEATEVVFVGYSLPEADYHVRVLLRRAIRDDATIVAVLSPRDDPSNAPPEFHWALAATRYERFFGPRVRLDFRGVAGHFAASASEKNHQDNLAVLGILSPTGSAVAMAAAPTAAAVDDGATAP